MSEYCCEAFREQASKAQAAVGGGKLYPPEIAPVAQFEPSEKGDGWNIYGCCGGGCYVVTEMKFCPYCGSSLAKAHP